MGLKNPDIYSAPEIYRQNGTLRRIGGTVTFGGKAPEAAITGFSGFPSFDTLLDVFAWDTKVRLIGDRDPRAERWYREMMGTLGGLTELSANLITLAPQGDLLTVQTLLTDRLRIALARVKSLVSNSFQVSAKVSGQHVTTVTGMSRYSYGVLADKGFGDTDVTANLLYTRTEQRRADPAEVAAPPEPRPCRHPRASSAATSGPSPARSAASSPGTSFRAGGPSSCRSTASWTSPRAPRR